MSTNPETLASNPELPQTALNDPRLANYAFRSPKQAQVFAFVLSYFTQYGCIPSLRAMCAHFGWSSRMTATKATRRLESAGLLVRLRPRNGTGGRSLLVPVGVKVLNKR
jgi:hypothetical protein